MSAATVEQADALEPLLCRDDLARIFGLSAAGVQRWQQRGWLPEPVRIGRSRRPLWRKSDIIDLLRKPPAAAQEGEAAGA
jgi:predicted DNA-binding transcriptional regulator AlpA